MSVGFKSRFLKSEFYCSVRYLAMLRSARTSPEQGVPGSRNHRGKYGAIYGTALSGIYSYACQSGCAGECK